MWLVGVHGGAGVTTLAAAGVGLDAGRSWPKRPAAAPGSPDPLRGPTVMLPVITGRRDPIPEGFVPGGVVLVARATASGLETATRTAAALQHDQVPSWLEVAGLIVVAAGPGRPHRLVRQRLELVAGWMPQVWQVPWVPELIYTDVDLVRYCRPYKAAIPADLFKLQQMGRTQ